MSVAIVIASKGRPVELGRWVDHLQRQTVGPVALVFAVTAASDLPADLGGATALICAPGSCAQRNAGLSSVLGTADIVAFFDDDYVPSSRCIEGIEALFGSRPDVVAANGMLLADGVNSPGISYARAMELINQHDSLPHTIEVTGTLGGLYGCNMAFRASAIGDERFDENLPLYAWQEDIDFSARVGKRGLIVKTTAFYGVHQGVKDARPSGVRLGYSQIANPLYLIGKGTMTVSEALPLIAKNVVKNHARALFPEPWIDRLGRCKGNWWALIDALMCRADPRNILRM